MIITKSYVSLAIVKIGSGVDTEGVKLWSGLRRCEASFLTYVGVA